MKRDNVVLANSNFQTRIPDPFAYIFPKHDAKVPNGAESIVAGDDKIKRYAIKNQRNGTVNNYELLDTELQPQGFERGDQIQIVDTSLGGKSTAQRMISKYQL